MSRPPDDDIDAEIVFHLQEMTEALVAQGWDEDQARAEAVRRYGDRRQYAAAMQRLRQTAAARRVVGGARPFEAAAQELRHAVRGLRRTPGYTLTAIATLALVTGANLTVLGIADGLMFRPLAYLRDPSSVHRVYWQWQDRGRTTTSASTQYPRFLDLQRDAAAFAHVAVFAERSVAVGDGPQAEQRRIAAVSATYFDFFDARPARGRFFDAGEDAIPRGADVAVLGYAFWRSRFAGRDDVIGQVLRIGDMRATIVGVAPAGFDGLNDGAPPAAFVPITTYAASTGTDDARTYFSAYKWGWVHLLVRRAPGVTRAEATQVATRTFRSTWPRFVADNPSMPAVDRAAPRAILSSVRLGGGPTAGPEARTSLWLLLVAGAVLLIGCANVANLSLVRALGRRDETRLKRALGIGRTRLAVGGLLEAVVLAGAGGLAALAVTQALRLGLAPVLEALRVPAVPVFADLRMLAATAVLVALTTVVTGVIPMQARRDAGLAPQTGAGRVSAGGRRLRGTLLVVQSLLSVVLLVGAGLFVRSLLAVYDAPLGYDPSRVLLLNRVTPPGGFDAAAQRALRDDLLRAVRALPSVEAAAWMSSAPFVSTSSTDLFVPGIDDAAALGPFTFQATTPGYFAAMGTAIVKGRPLLDSDGAGALEVAVVSESMGRLLWPGRDAIGECFRMRTADSPCRRVVGIAEDIVQRSIADGPRLHYYVPIDQYPRTFGNGLLVRLRGNPARDGEDVRRALQAVMPAGSYLVAQPLAAAVAAQQASWRLGAAVLVSFAGLALVVAAVGLHGTVSQDIAQRRQEWAVRAALGAGGSSIVWMIVARTLRLVIVGVVPGLLLASAFGRWVQPLLYRTSGFDPLSYVAAASAMLTVAAVASLLPARRVASAAPVAALRGN